MARDTREQGISYGYVVIPKGGLRVDGVMFPEGPRPAGKKGWFKLLVAKPGVEEISEAEYEAYLRGQYPGKGVNGAEPGDTRRDQDAPAAKRKQPRPRRDAGRVQAGG